MSSSLILCKNNKPFLYQIVTSNENGFYKTTSDNQLSDWMEKKHQSTSQSQTCTKKRSGSLFGGLMPVWSTTAFWILAKSLHLKSMLSKLMRCTKNCNAYTRHWSTEWAQFFSPITSAFTSADTSEAEGIGLRRFASSARFTWPLTSWLPLLQTSGQPYAGSTTSRRHKMLSKSWLDPEHRFFHSGEINQLISHWQKWIGCNSYCFD